MISGSGMFLRVFCVYIFCGIAEFDGSWQDLAVKDLSCVRLCQSRD